MNQQWAGISILSLAFAWLLIPLGAHADASSKASKLTTECIGGMSATSTSFPLRITAWANSDSGTLVVIEGNKNGKMGIIAVDPATTTPGTGDFITTFKATITSVTYPEQPNLDPNAAAQVVCARYKGGPLGEDSHGNMIYTPDNACILLTCRPAYWVDSANGRVPAFPEQKANTCDNANMKKLLCPPPPKSDAAAN